MDPSADSNEPESTDALFASPKSRKTYEKRRSHSESSKTISSPEPELFTSPAQNNTSRYGRPRKPKITEDFYNIEDILYPYERITSPARSPKKKSSNPKVDTFKTNDTLGEKSSVKHNELCGDSLAKLEISPIRNIDLINLNEGLDSENLLAPLTEDNSDVSKVLKIVSDTSSNSCDFSPKSATQVKSVKTYTNRKKLISETVIESFGLPDYSPVLNGAGVDILEEHQYASSSKDDVLAPLSQCNTKSDELSSNSESDSEIRTKSSNDFDKLKQIREQLKVAEKTQISRIQENIVKSPEKSNSNKTRPNILRSNKVKNAINEISPTKVPEMKTKNKIPLSKSTKSAKLDEQKPPKTLVNRQSTEGAPKKSLNDLPSKKSLNILKSSDNTSKKLQNDIVTDLPPKKPLNILKPSDNTQKKSLNDSKVTLKKSSDISSKKSLKKIKTSNILSKKSLHLKKSPNPAKILLNSRKSSDDTPISRKSSDDTPISRKSSVDTLISRKSSVETLISRKSSDATPISRKSSEISSEIELDQSEDELNQSFDDLSLLKRKSLDISTTNVVNRMLRSKTPVNNKKISDSTKEFVNEIKNSEVTPRKLPIEKSSNISPKLLRDKKSKPITARRISLLSFKPYNTSPKSTIINLKSSDILPKQQKHNYKLNAGAKNASIAATVISHKIKNKRRLHKQYLSKKLNPKLKKLRSADLTYNQVDEVKSYKDLTPSIKEKLPIKADVTKMNSEHYVKIGVKTELDVFTPEVGCLAWSRVGNYPFWPSIITFEPNTTRFSKFIPGRGKCLCYHVHFFGDNGRRSWVFGSHIYPFKKRSDLEIMALSVSKKSKPRDARHLSAFIIHPNRLSKWETAVSESQSLTNYPPEVRIKKFFELVKTVANKKKRKFASIKSPSTIDKAHKRLKLDKTYLNSIKTPKTNSTRSSRSNSPKSGRLSPEIKRDVDDDIKPIIFEELDERALIKKFKNAKLGNTSEIIDLEKMDLTRKLRKSVPIESPKPAILFTDDSCSDSESKDSRASYEDKIKNEARDTPSPIFYVSAAVRQKRINLLRRVTKERVCNICGKGDVVAKCKGSCSGFYHIECDKKIKQKLEKSLAILTEDSDSNVDSDLEKQRSSSTETKDSSFSEKSDNKPEIIDINSNKPPDKDYKNEDDSVEVKLEEISNSSKDDLTVQKIQSADNDETYKVEDEVKIEEASEKGSLEEKYESGSDEENSPTKCISLADKIDMKMQEVMQSLITQTKYTDSTTDEGSESELSESSNQVKCPLKVTQSDSVDSKCESEISKSSDLLISVGSDVKEPIIEIESESKSSSLESVDSKLITPKVTQRIIKHVTADGEFSVVEDVVEEEIDEYDFSKFKCSHCSLGVKPPCFICGNDVAKSGDDKKHKCTTGQCGKYYHYECLKDWPQAKWVITSIKKNVNNENLCCPYHNCHTCISDDPRGPLGRYAHEKLTKCIRCPTTYHTSNHCIPAGTEILTTYQIICPKHIYQQQERHNRKVKIMPHVNASWCFICSMGGSLICCETCPSSFHAECLKLNPPEGRYLCEECESGRLPLYDEIVWVKLGAYRWWPAQIIFPIEIPDKVNNFPHNVGEFVVKFFGSHDYYWVNRGRVFLFQEGDTGHASSKKSTVDGLFIKAIDEAIKAHKIFQEDRNERAVEARNGMKPPPFIKIKVNRPVGDVRSTDADTSNTTPCDCDPSWKQPCGPDSDCLNRILMTECNPLVCAAANRCRNQQFEKRQYTPVAPFKTPARGWGLKTLVDISKGTFVIEYVGEVINEAEYRRRIKRKHEQKDENYYFLTIDKDRMIDAGPKGNVARFMNHSCNPNCETQKWNVNGGTRVGLFAIMDIPQDAELTFNYNLECVGEEKKECRCEAPNCSGFIGVKAKQEETSKKKRKSTVKLKRRTKKLTTKSKKQLVEAVTCFVCGEPDPTQLCDRDSCTKVYHLQCVELEYPQDGKWFCPWHSCNTCTKRTTRSCYMCINSYCPLHSKGNIRYDRVKGFICTQHDAKDTDMTDSTDSKQKSIKPPKQRTLSETDRTSTEKEDSRVSTPAYLTRTTKRKSSIKSSRRSSEISVNSELNTIETELMSDNEHFDDNSKKTAAELKQIEDNKAIMDDLRQITGNAKELKTPVASESKSVNKVSKSKKSIVASRMSTRNSTPVPDIIVIDSDEDLTVKSKTLNHKPTSVKPSLIKTKYVLPLEELSIIKQLVNSSKFDTMLKDKTENEESSDEELSLAKQFHKSTPNNQGASSLKKKIQENITKTGKCTPSADVIRRSKDNSIKTRKMSSGSINENKTKEDIPVADIVSHNNDVREKENKFLKEIEEFENTELKKRKALSLREPLDEDDTNDDKSSSEDNIPLVIYKKKKMNPEHDIEREDSFVEYAHLVDLKTTQTKNEKIQNYSSHEHISLTELPDSDQSSLITDSDSTWEENSGVKRKLKKQKKSKKTKNTPNSTELKTASGVISKLNSSITAEDAPTVISSNEEDTDFTPKVSRFKKKKVISVETKPQQSRNKLKLKSPKMLHSSDDKMKKVTIDVQRTEPTVKQPKLIYLKIVDSPEKEKGKRKIMKYDKEIQKLKAANQRTELESSWIKKTKSTTSKVEEIETFLDRLKKLRTEPESILKKPKEINAGLVKFASPVDILKKRKSETKIEPHTVELKKISKSEDETPKSDKSKKVSREVLNLVRSNNNVKLNHIQALIEDVNKLHDDGFPAEGYESQDDESRPKTRKFNLGLRKRETVSDSEEPQKIRVKSKNLKRNVRRSLRNKSDQTASIFSELEDKTEKRPKTPVVRKSLRQHQENTIVKAIIAESLIESCSEYESAIDEPIQPTESVKRKRGRPRKYPRVPETPKEDQIVTESVKPKKDDSIDSETVKSKKEDSLIETVKSKKDVTIDKETVKPKKDNPVTTPKQPVEEVEIAEQEEPGKRPRGRPKKIKLIAEEPPKNVETVTELYKMKLNTDQIPKNPFENHINEVKLTANVPERHLRVVLRKHTEIDSKIDSKFLKMQNDIERDLPIRKRSKLRYEAQL